MKIPGIVRLEESGPVTKEHCELVRVVFIAAAQTGTHMALWEVLSGGYKDLVYHTIGWELNRILDETGEVNQGLWQVFVASVPYMIKRYDGFRGSDLFAWMQRADADGEKKKIIRAVVPLELRTQSAEASAQETVSV